MQGLRGTQGNGRGQDEITEIFRKHWDVYRNIIEHDYMSHKAAYEKLHEILIEDDRPFSFVDLACGDAYASSRCLEGTSVAEYTGVDLSEWALGLAEKELERVRARKRLVMGDFEKFGQYLDAPPDVIWVGLSVHHLPTEEKGRFMKTVRKEIAPGGMFLVYEPTLQKGEKVARYIDRFRDVVSKTWTGLANEELEIVYDHVAKSDLPELKEDWIRLAREAGFESAEEVYEDPLEFYSVFRFGV